MKLKKNLPIFILSFISVLLMIIFLSKGDIVLNGVKKGLSLTANVLIPSLFPFMVVANFCANEHILTIISKPFTFIGDKIFKIPKHFSGIYFLSLIGGYPIGACLVSENVKSGAMDRKTAERMLCFCTNAGPSFVLTYIGLKMLGNINLGITILVAQIIAGLIIGYFLSFKNRFSNSATMVKTLKKPEIKKPSKRFDFAGGFVASVNLSCQTMLIVTGFVIFFSAISEYINMLPLFKENPFLCACINAFFEISNGITSIANANLVGIQAPIAMCVATGFSGLCIIFQIKAICFSSNISVRPFLISRIFQIILSSIICFIIIKLSPNEVVTWTAFNGNQVENFASSPLVAIILLCMCAILLVSFTSEKRKKAKSK